MKTLVTGGAGFIGSNLVDALLARGDEVTVVDDLSTGRRGNLDGALASGAELVELDIRDAAALAALASERSPRPSSTWPRRSTSASRWRTRPSTPKSTSAAPPTCSRRPAPPTRSRVVFVSTGGAIYGEGDGQQLPLDEERADRAALRLRPEQVRGRGLPGPLRAPLRALQHRPAARQRLRPAPGPARRGRRDRDLLRPAAAPAAARPSSATASRPATTYMWATWSRRRWPRPRPASPARSTSAPASRPTCSSWPRPWAGSAEPRTSSPSSRPARAGEVQRITLDAARAERELGWRPQTGLDDGPPPHPRLPVAPDR